MASTTSPCTYDVIADYDKDVYDQKNAINTYEYKLAFLHCEVETCKIRDRRTRSRVYLKHDAQRSHY